MKTLELDYFLPEDLIAQQPAHKRSQSKLLFLSKDRKTYEDLVFSDIFDHLKAGDCLVINNTRVLPARFFAQRLSGASFEGLFLDMTSDGLWHVMLKNSRRLKMGESFTLLDLKKHSHCKAIAESKNADGTWNIKVVSNENLEQVLEKIGFAPLPPYIKRPKGGESPDFDRQRYQTVFAKENGAVAAPTAGLHFTDELLSRLKDKGVKLAQVTLHVGAGTFKPVTAENLEDHEIHSERYSLDQENAQIINKTKQTGGRVIAVGTTSVRTLETIARSGQIKASSGNTQLFITPGFEYKAVDGMVTNFHLPKSTLLALVGAFAGMDFIKQAYKHAVENKYRFFSYGDAMLIL